MFKKLRAIRQLLQLNNKIYQVSRSAGRSHTESVEVVQRVLSLFAEAARAARYVTAQDGPIVAKNYIDALFADTGEPYPDCCLVSFIPCHHSPIWNQVQ